jgi:hypothetical protein
MKSELSTMFIGLRTDVRMKTPKAPLLPRRAERMAFSFCPSTLNSPTIIVRLAPSRRHRRVHVFVHTSVHAWKPQKTIANIALSRLLHLLRLKIPLPGER